MFGSNKKIKKQNKKQLQPKQKKKCCQQNIKFLNQNSPFYLVYEKNRAQNLSQLFSKRIFVVGFYVFNLLSLRCFLNFCVVSFTCQ